MSLSVYTCYVKVIGMEMFSAGPPGTIGMQCQYIICNVLTNTFVNTISLGVPFGYLTIPLTTPLQEILVKEQCAAAIQGIETATPLMVFEFMP